MFGATVWIFLLGELKPVNWGHSGVKTFGFVSNGEEAHGSNIRNWNIGRSTCDYALGYCRESARAYWDPKRRRRIVR